MRYDRGCYEGKGGGAAINGEECNLFQGAIADTAFR